MWNGRFLPLRNALLSLIIYSACVQRVISTRHPIIDKGRKLDRVGNGEKIDVTTESELLDAMNNLQPNQMLRLHMDEVQMNDILSIGVSGVTVRGRKNRRTVIRCPAEEPAMRIGAPNVIIRSVTFEGCHGESAAVISTSTSTTEGEVRFVDVGFHRNGREAKSPLGGAVYIDGCDSGPCTQFSVTFRSCSFRRNAATFGGALFVRGVDVTIEDSLFERNFADLSGGALYLDGKGQASLTVKNSTFSTNMAGKNAFDQRILDLKQQLVSSRRLEDIEIVGMGGAIRGNLFDVMSIEESIFDNNIGCRGAGGLSLLQGGSGESRPLSFSISESTFTRNKGFCFPGRVDYRFDNVRHLSGNLVPTYGGAMTHESYVEASIDWIVTHSSFQLNEAVGGGGIFIQATSMSTTEHQIQYSNFSRNFVFRTGGSLLLQLCIVRMVSVKVTESVAMYGGGVLAWVHSTLIIDRSPEGYPPTSIENNVAITGAGIIVVLTRYVELSGVVIRGNMANQRGGGMQVFQSRGPILLKGVTVEENMAVAAGGLDFELLPDFDITSDAGEPTIIKNNRAVSGAGFHCTMGSYHQVNNTKFFGNKALSLEEFSRLSDLIESERNFPLLSPREIGVKLIGHASTAADTLRLYNEFLEGYGGAMLMNFQRSRLVSSIGVEFDNIEVRNNEAFIGGGASFLLPNLKWNEGDQARCPDTNVEKESCARLTITNSVFKKNKATYAAAIYSTVADGVAVGCNLTTILVASDLAAKNFTSKDSLDYYCTEFDENEVAGTGLTGSDFGSPAHGLVVANWSGSLLAVASGDPLAVPCRDNPQKPCSLEIMITDILNQTITSGTSDARLSLTIESKHVRGAKKYAAKNGVVTIDDTFAIGINITTELFIFHSNDRSLNLTLNLKTRACQPGEIELVGRGNLCYRCPQEFYGFDPKESKCRRCESEGICNGGASRIPRDDFWHSTPFSPVFRRCLRRGACNFAGRAENLSAFLQDPTTTEEKLGYMKRYIANRESMDVLNITGYDQCREGYGGILCGSCREGYGHGPSGACERCPRNPTVKRLLILISIGLLTLVVSVNAVITLLSMNSRFLLVDMDARGHRLSIVPELKRSPPIRRSLNIENLFPEQPSCSGLRTEEIEEGEAGEEENEEGKEVLHSRLVTTVRLAETLKILVNYLQVNGAALYLRATWNSTIEGVLSVEATAVGVSSSIFSAPFECNFEDSVSIPASIAAFWMRLAIPWIVLGILLLSCLSIWMVLRRQPKFFSRCTVERLITCAIVISTVTVYFTFLDIVRELLSAVNCVKIEPAESYVEADHPYIQYSIETLNKRVWAEDTAVICYEGAHLTVGIVGYIGLFLVFCLVLGIIAWLPINKKKVMKKYFIERYWFLYQAYRSQWSTTAWESTILVRKGLIAVVIVFSVQLSPALQLEMCVGILSLFLMLQAWFSPFKVHKGFDNIPKYGGAFFMRCGLNQIADFFVTANNAIHLNHLELASLFSSITIFYSGVVLLDSDTTQMGIWLMVSFTVCVNVSFAFYVVFRLYCGVHLVVDMHLSLSNSGSLSHFQNSLSLLSLMKKSAMIGGRKLSSAVTLARDRSAIGFLAKRLNTHESKDG